MRTFFCPYSQPFCSIFTLIRSLLSTIPGPTRVAQTLSGPSCVLFERHLSGNIVNAFLLHAWPFLTSFESMVSLQHLSIGWEKRVVGKSPLESCLGGHVGEEPGLDFTAEKLGADPGFLLSLPSSNMGVTAVPCNCLRPL